MAYLIWFTYLAIGFWTPWWSSLGIALVVGAFSRDLKQAIFAGSGGGFLIWLLITGYFNFRGHNIVATRIGELFGVGSAFGFHVILSLAFGIIHGVFSGCGHLAFGCWSVRSSPPGKPREIQSEF